MDKDAIDWEMVIHDPDYRRLVIARLNAVASAKQDPGTEPDRVQPNAPSAPLSA